MTALAMCFDPELGSGDLALATATESALNEETTELATAILCSLFTNRRDPSREAGGSWQDSLYSDSFGSLLWTKMRETITQTLIIELEQICRDALRHLVVEQRVKSIDVAVERSHAHAVTITITSHLNDDSTFNLTEEFDLSGGENAI